MVRKKQKNHILAQLKKQLDDQNTTENTGPPAISRDINLDLYAVFILCAEHCVTDKTD